MVRVRLVATVCLVVLLAAMLAGCSAPAQTETSDSGLKSSYVDADNKTHGFVAGVVLTVAGEPLPGAVVTILSVDTSATTDSTGKFQFADVANGEQTLRVEKENYRTLQRPFTVMAGKIVELEVVLTRADGLQGGAIEHFHDHWRGQERYTIFEKRFESGGGNETYHRLVPDEGRIVPPGTDRITIDTSVEPTPDDSGHRDVSWELYLFPPPAPGDVLFDQVYKFRSGDTRFEFILPTSEITDHGHASYTNWEFMLYTKNNVRGLTSPVYNQFIANPLDITITAHKGELAIDPPHPKYWADADRIEMPTGSETLVQCEVPGEVPRNCGFRSPNPQVRFGGPYPTIRHGATRECEQPGCMILDRGGLVPPGTTGISFDLEVWHEATAAGTEPPELGDTAWVLGFKTAAPHPNRATWDDYTWIEPFETYDPEPQAGRHHQQGLRYMIDVPRGAEDPYYTAYSGWVFMMAVRGQETASDWSDVSCSTSLCGHVGFGLNNFFVHNDSPTAEAVEPA